MKITFLGATHEVTGSCFYVEACGKNLLSIAVWSRAKICLSISRYR